MASILDLLNTPIGEELVLKTSEETSETREKMVSILVATLPVLLSALQTDIYTNKAESLYKLLSKEKYQGDLLKNLSSTTSEELKKEGDQILESVFGNKQSELLNALAAVFEVKPRAISVSFKMSAAIIFDILGNLIQKENLALSDLSILIFSVLGANSKYTKSFLDTILKENKNADIIDDASGMILGGGNDKSKDQSILGGYTGGK